MAEGCKEPYVVVPYYLSQGYNRINAAHAVHFVVVPYYLSQGYNAWRITGQIRTRCSSLLSLSRV